MKSMCGLVAGFTFIMKTGLGFTFSWKNGGWWLRLGWRLGFGLGAGVAFVFPCFTFTMKTGVVFGF